VIQDTVAANFAKLPSKKLGIVRGTVQGWHRMRLLDVRAPSDFSRVTPPPPSPSWISRKKSQYRRRWRRWWLWWWFWWWQPLTCPTHCRGAEWVVRLEWVEMAAREGDGEVEDEDEGKVKAKCKFRQCAAFWYWFCFACTLSVSI